jgi:hypothetical protein
MDVSNLLDLAAPTLSRSVSIRRGRVSGVLTYTPGYPHTRRGSVYEHTLVVERVIGRCLPKGACIHHVNGDPTDNRTCNLLVCPGRAYHKEIHRKMRVRAAGGNPWADRMCGRCGPRPSREFGRVASGFRAVCRRCAVISEAERRVRRGPGTRRTPEQRRRDSDYERRRQQRIRLERLNQS